MAEDARTKALVDLIGELNAASELTLNLRMVPGREAGYHGEIHSGNIVPSHLKYSGEGGRRKRRGAGNGPSGMTAPESSCDNMYVSLAIDSAIILAGAAAVAGAGYGGFATLQYFMTVYSLNPAVVAVVTALYDALVVTLSALTSAGSSAASAVGSLASAASAVGPVVITAASGVASSTPPVITALVRLSPGIAIGRYIGTGKSAREDAMAILNGLNEKYASVRDYAGRVTRSISEKKTQLTSQITAAKQAIAATYVSAGESSATAVASVSAGYQVIKRKLCGVVDRVVAGVMVVSEIAGSLNSELGDLSASSGGRRKTRRMRKSAKKSRKNRRRSYRRG
jgi:hypothetical protein